MPQGKDVANPPPGTVLDNTVTRFCLQRFLFSATSCKSGNCDSNSYGGDKGRGCSSWTQYYPTTCLQIDPYVLQLAWNCQSSSSMSVCSQTRGSRWRTFAWPT